MNRNLTILGYVMLGVLCSVAVNAADRPTVQLPPAHEQESIEQESNVPKGVIGVSLDIGADRVGEPAVLYVAMVHPEGPAQEAGVAHGDEITTVDGMAVSGKTYEQLVRMIRGPVGSTVKLGVKGETGTREISIPRVPSENLSQGPPASGRRPSR